MNSRDCEFVDRWSIYIQHSWWSSFVDSLSVHFVFFYAERFTSKVALKFTDSSNTFDDIRCQVIQQTRRIIFYWYQMKFSEPAILSFEKSIAIKQLPHFTTLPQTQCIQSMDLSPPEVLSEPSKSGLLAHDSSSDTNEDRFIESDGWYHNKYLQPAFPLCPKPNG